MAYNEIILDGSVLDVDSWFPQEAIDQIADIIKAHAKASIENQSVKNKEYTYDCKVFGKYANNTILKGNEYSSYIPKSVNYSLTGGQVA
ncbi:hypothetical protein [Streptococcus hyointestinalis]|uniref:hypothetical protein n=1 Tax=Streptococcus hyointestinalis TaxID=1337 RepID=UPI003D0270FE